MGLEVSESASASESGGERVGEVILGIWKKCFFGFGFVICRGWCFQLSTRADI